MMVSGSFHSSESNLKTQLDNLTSTVSKLMLDIKGIHRSSSVGGRTIESRLSEIEATLASLEKRLRIQERK